MEVAIFAGGCFWCTEAIFKNLKGVSEVIPGYVGGSISNPTYNQVSSGESGHAEAVKIIFDSNVIRYQDLLEVFFKLHDPTQLNRQGADIGTQYRSEIFYTSDIQKETATSYTVRIQKTLNKPIVTKITKASEFFPAEEYHREYYFKNRSNVYCQLVIDPKIQKLKKEFGSLMKSIA